MDEIPVGLEEDVLTMMCFSKFNAAKLSLMVDIELFSTRIYKKIAEQANKYLREYDRPPGIHLLVYMAAEIKQRGDEGKQIVAVINKLHEALASDTYNERFILNHIETFIRQQKMRKKADRYATLIEQGKLDEADASLGEHDSNLKPFSKGVLLSDATKILSFMDKIEEDYFPTGIKKLDEYGIVPARGTMFLMIAPPKSGKSWFLINCGKNAMLAGRSVLHITLENSEAVTGKRYVQAYLSLARSTANADTRAAIPVMHRDERGKIVGVTKLELTAKMLDDTSKEMVTRRLHQLKTKAPILIKGFPSGTLSVDQLDSYLSVLDKTYNFRPDELIVDYPDLMKLTSVENKRGELGQIFVNLRGIAVDRNLALVVATQSNRNAITAKTIGMQDVSEDISKVGTADTILTYNQTPYEEKINTARIFVAGAREAEDHIMIGITQNYKHGQFCLDSWLNDNSTYGMVLEAFGVEDTKNEKVSKHGR